MRLAVFGVIKLKILVFSFQVRLFWEIFSTIGYLKMNLLHTKWEKIEEFQIIRK